MTMPQLSGRQANIYAIVAFVATLLLTYLMPGNAITLGGLLVVIFLSVFIPSRSSTIIAGVVSIAIVFGVMFWSSRLLQSAESWMDALFLSVLILFTTGIVLFIKNLIKNMQWDKSHMTSLFENATEGIILTNRTAQIVLVNPAACKMFGYTEEDLINQKIEVLLPSKHRPGHTQLRGGFYKTPQNRVMGSGRDLHGQKKDGSNFPVEVSLSAYKQNNNQFVIAFIVDITHRKEIEQSMLRQQQQLEKITADVRLLNADLEAKVEERTLILKEALQRLEQSQEELNNALDKERELNEIKSRFVSMASHEFRTPLSAVLSSASLISKYTTTEQQESRLKHINRIKDSVKHLNDLLEDFLSLGKLNEGKVGPLFEAFNLPEAVQDTIDEVRGLIKEDQHVQYTHAGPEMILSDKKLLKNVLINLISNAVKFSDKSCSIVVHSKVADNTAAISVKDEGIGISDDDQQHLFTTFFRGKNAVNIQGTGMGLHIVKRYADLLGGKLKLKSKLGGGTTITILIPTNAHEQNNIGN